MNNEKKTNNKALRISQEFLTAVFSSIQDGISIHDTNFNIIGVNKRMNDLYSHYLPLEGKKCYEVFQGRSSECKTCPATRSLETGKLERNEVSLVQKNGVTGTLELFAFPMIGENGKRLGVVEYVRDITERKKMENNLRENEERTNALLSAMPDLMFIFNKKGVFIDYNYQNTESLYMMPQDFLNRDVSEVLPAALTQLTKKKIETVFLTGEPQMYEYELDIKNERRYFESRLTPCGEDRVLSIVRDITERKLSDIELWESGERAFKQRTAITQLVLDDGIIHGDLNSALNLTTKILSDALNVARAGIWLVSKEGKELKCLSLFDARKAHHSKGQVLEIEKFPGFFAAINAESRINVENAQTDSRTSEMTESYLAPLGITSMLDAGIIIEGKFTGVICLEHIGGKRTWHTDEESFASTASAIIAQILTNFRRKQAEGVQKKTKEELERYFTSSLDLLCIASTEGKFIRLNPEWERVLGYSINELGGKMFLDLVHPEDLEDTLAAIKKLENQENVLSFVNRYRCQDGSYRWIEWRSHPKGKLIYAAARDISDRIEAQKALSSQLEIERMISEISSLFTNLTSQDLERGINRAIQILGEFFDADRSYLFQTTRDGKYLNNTHEWCKTQTETLMQTMKEIQADNFPGIMKRLNNSEAVVIRNSADSIPENTEEKELLFARSVKTILLIPVTSAQKQFGFMGFDCLRKDKEWTSEQLTMLKIVAEIVSGTLARQEAEKSLSFERAQILSVFDSIKEIIYVSDPDTYEILYINPTMRDNFSYDPTGGICYRELQNRNTPCEFCTNRIILQNKGEPHQWEYYNPSVERTFFITDKIITWPDGRDVRFELAVDITARKRAEEERERLQANLHQAQKMESIGRLAGGVAHDFNNMLAIIMGQTDMALDQVDPQQPFYVTFQEIRKAAQQSTVLTQQLLAFAHKQTISPKLLDLNETIEDMTNMLKRLIGENIEIVWKPSDKLWKVMGDGSQINQILTNLCVNARDAINGDGKIVIETGNASFDESFCHDHPQFVTGEFVCLSVKDNGCGIDKKNMSKLFEPFYTTKEIGKGTGLGLATIYGIVKQNKGFVNMESEKDKGSSFYIYLPRHYVDEKVKEEKIPSDTSRLGHETILLVEDEPGANEIITMMLEKFGYSVLSAAKPGEAIDLATVHTGKIQLLFTDVVMPEMNGLNLAEKLKSFYPDLKILFMSGYSAKGITDKGIIKEGVNFIKKPFSMKELSVKVRETLDN